MKTESSREILKALLEDSGPLDIDVVPTPERREQISAFLAQEKEKFVAISRLQDKDKQRDLSR